MARRCRATYCGRSPGDVQRSGDLHRKSRRRDPEDSPVQSQEGELAQTERDRVDDRQAIQSFEELCEMVWIGLANVLAVEVLLDFNNHFDGVGP